MKNVLYVLNSSLIGGANRAMFGLFARLDRTRFNPIAVVPGVGAVTRELERRNVSYLICDVLGSTTRGTRIEQLTRVFQLRRWLKKFGIDILHANDPLTYRLPAIASYRLPVVRICHFQSPPHPETLQWTFRAPPDVVVTCNQAMRMEFRDPIYAISPRTRIVVAPNFADVEAFSPGSEMATFRQDIIGDKDARIVSIVGLVSERKGHRIFLEMASRLLRQPGNENLRFLVIGEDILTNGTYRTQMERYAQMLGIPSHVKFLGFRDDIPDLMRITDVLVLPSISEGMPLSIAEAMACGVPVVAFDIPGVNEIVADQITGFLVATNDLDGLTSQTDRLLQDDALRARMGAESRNRIVRSYSADAHVREVVSAYEALAL